MTEQTGSVQETVAPRTPSALPEVGASHKAAALGSIGTSADPEVAEKASRRRFTADYKLKILKEADACTTPGSLGSLLRREGLYASNLNTWRRQRDRGALKALSPKKRGRKQADRNPLAEENARLRKENERLMKRLKHAELVIEIQKKISQMTGIPLSTDEEGGRD